MLMQTWLGSYVREQLQIFQISTSSVTELCFVRSRAAHCLNQYSGWTRSLCWFGYWSRSHSRNDLGIMAIWHVPKGQTGCCLACLLAQSTSQIGQQRWSHLLGHSSIRNEYFVHGRSRRYSVQDYDALVLVGQNI